MPPLAGELDQAELRKTGPIAHELGIERDERLARQLLAQLRELAGGGEQAHPDPSRLPPEHSQALRAALTYGQRAAPQPGRHPGLESPDGSIAEPFRRVLTSARRAFERGVDACLPAARSLVEQIGMGAGAHEVQLVPGDPVDQQPVRVEMGVAVALSVAPERMIPIVLRQRLPGQEQPDRLAQLCMSLPRLSARFTSRRNCPERTAARTSDAEILEQRLGRLEPLALALLQLGHGPAGGGVRHLDLERQALLVGDAQHQEADRVGDRQPHGLERRRRALLGGGIDARANDGIGRHDSPPLCSRNVATSRPRRKALDRSGSGVQRQQGGESRVWHGAARRRAGSGRASGNRSDRA